MKKPRQHNETYLRMMTVRDWLSKGYSLKTIHKLIEEKFDLCSLPSRTKVIKAALEEMHSATDPNSLRSILVEKLDNITEHAFKNENYGDAIRAINEMSKLYGLHTINHNVKAKVTEKKVITGLSKDEILEILADEQQGC